MSRIPEERKLIVIITWYESFPHINKRISERIGFYSYYKEDWINHISAVKKIWL